jgi:hypothetical protein
MSLLGFLKQHQKNLGEIFLAAVIGLVVWFWWHSTRSIDLRFSDQLVKVSSPSVALRAKFHSNVLGQEVTFNRGAGRILHGYLTSNRDFLREVIAPAIAPYLKQLKQMPPTEQINQLTLAGYTLFQSYFGKDFYRWGGDLLDLDDPQEEGARHQYRYGLDCSGFVALPYELAVYLGLMKPTAPGAEFASKGFLLYCQRTGRKDQGGRLGANRYRLDTIDLADLGREILAIPQNGRLRRQDLKYLQPGDIVGRTGHFGILVEIQHKLYYLESGGWVVPKFGYRPVRAEVAIKLLATRYPISVRRVLPDRNL